MERPKYIKAARLNADGTVADVAHLMVLPCHTSETGYEHLVLSVYFLGLQSGAGDRLFAPPPSARTEPMVFDLRLVHAGYNEARFAGAADIVIPRELQGRGIGSYVMSALIEWGTIRRPYYCVMPLPLGINDARTNEDRDSRNGFYRRLNFDMDFRGDPEERRGCCCAETLAQLRPYWNPKKITVVDLVDEIRRYQVDNAQVAGQVRRMGETITSDQAMYRKEYTRHRRERLGFVAVIAFLVLALVLSILR